MPAIVLPALAAALIGLFSPIINIFMQLPTWVKYLVFYGLFLGLGLEIPGTHFSIGRTLLSPFIEAVFSFLGFEVNYDILLGLFTIGLLLYFVHFMIAMGKRDRY